MKALIIFLSLLAAPMSQAQPKHAKPSSGEFMGVKFGVPISRQFPVCPANGEYLPDNSRCFDNSWSPGWVRWEGEQGRPITIKWADEKVGTIWYVEREFPADSLKDVTDDLIVKHGRPACDKHMGVNIHWGCQWNTNWGSIILLWRPDASHGNNILIAGGTRAYFASLQAEQRAKEKQRRNEESF